jgi:hypothetical protein
MQTNNLDLIFGGIMFFDQDEINDVIKNINDYPDKIYIPFSEIENQLNSRGLDFVLERINRRNAIILNYKTITNEIETRFPEYYI